MNQQAKRAALGIALAVLALGAGSLWMLSPAPIDLEPLLAMQGRTPIDVASLGPQVGEQVPTFNLPDQNGQLRNLESILGPNGAMLLFHRSADW